MKKKPTTPPDAADPSINSGQAPSTGSTLRPGSVQGSPPQANSEQDLRHQAEAKLSERKKKAAPPPTTDLDTRRLVHELQVHQIELEIQNEELVQSRSQVEAGLRQYTELYDLAPVGYFALARDGAILQVNLAGANLLGVERGALITRRFGVFESAQSRTTFNTFLEKVFGSQQKETCEVALQKDGSAQLWVHMEAITEDGQECHAVVVDITERKQVEEVLRESEERYRSLFENMLNGFAYCQMLYENGRPQDFIYLDVNKVFESLTGLKNVIGRKVSDIIPGIRESDRSLFEIYGRVAWTGKPETFEMFVESLNDWYSISVYSPKKEFFVAVFDVITERKRAEEKILRQLEELRRWQDVTLGREDRSRQLKREVNELLVRLGETIRYPSQESDEPKDQPNVAL